MTEYSNEESLEPRNVQEDNEDVQELDDKSSVLEVLETLLAAHTSAEERGIPIQISLTADFIKEIVHELRNTIEILSYTGELVCMIEEPLASQIFKSAVKKYVDHAIVDYLNGPQT